MKSNYLNNVKFLLSVLIICIHSTIDPELTGIDISASNYVGYYYFQYFVCEILARIAVPLFFAISGYLFFSNEKPFNWDFYSSKMKKRLYSLVLPYICWNLIYVIIRLLENLLHLSSNSQPVWEWGLSDYIYAFWATPNGNTPIDAPLWYMKSLLLVFILSPIIHYLLNKLGKIFLLFLGCCWLMNWQLPSITTSAIFFVSIGAYIRINNVKFSDCHLLKWGGYLFIVFSIMNLVGLKYFDCAYINKIAIVTGMVSFMRISNKAYEKKMLCIPDYIAESSFFVYAYHYKFAIAYTYLFSRIIHCTNSLIVSLLFISSVLVIAVLGVLAYSIMKRISPKVLSILTGGRI